MRKVLECLKETKTTLLNRCWLQWNWTILVQVCCLTCWRDCGKISYFYTDEVAVAENCDFTGKMWNGMFGMLKQNVLKLYLFFFFSFLHDSCKMYLYRRPERGNQYCVASVWSYRERDWRKIKSVYCHRMVWKWAIQRNIILGNMESFTEVDFLKSGVLDFCETWFVCLLFLKFMSCVCL